MPELTPITASNIDAEILQGDPPSLLFFTARWCRPSREVKETLRAAVEEVGDKMRYGQVDVDEEQEIARRMDVRTVPTIVFLAGGVPVSRIRGQIQKLALLTRVSEVLTGEVS